jgi:hypothetical protein
LPQEDKKEEYEYLLKIGSTTSYLLRPGLSLSGGIPQLIILAQLFIKQK